MAHRVPDPLFSTRRDNRAPIASGAACIENSSANRDVSSRRQRAALYRVGCAHENAQRHERLCRRESATVWQSQDERKSASQKSGTFTSTSTCDGDAQHSLALHGFGLQFRSSEPQSSLHRPDKYQVSLARSKASTSTRSGADVKAACYRFRWRLAACTDCNRVLRVPGLLNRKYSIPRNPSLKSSTVSPIRSVTPPTFG